MIVRKAKEDDIIQLRKLFHVTFNNEITDIDWRWKYSTPLGSISIVLEENGKIVAHYGGIGVCFIINGKRFKSFMACDVMTHPDYRRMGMFKRLAMLFYQENSDAAFTFGFPSERHARLGKLAGLRYTDYRYTNKCSTDLNERTRSKGFFLNISTGWDNLESDIIDTLWHEKKYENNICIEKDSQYVLWRYKSCPFKKFEPVILKNIFGRVKGYAVTSMMEEELRVYDFIISKDFDADVFWKKIMEYASKSGAKKISLWVNPCEPAFDNFTNLGFKKVDDIPYVFVWIRDKTLDPDVLLKNYCYRLGDYDAS
jgi:predicted acetyltransferase